MIRLKHSSSVAIFIIGLLVALRDLRLVPYDDAAITFRYAWNISHGLGWVYNLGDRTNGASSPFYTLILAGGSLLRLPIPGLAQTIGILSYAGILVLIFTISKVLIHRFLKVSKVITSLPYVAVALFLLSEGCRSILLSGMESAFCSLLGLLSIRLMVSRKYTFSWITLGIAVFTKLDALALLPTLIILFTLYERVTVKKVAKSFVLFITVPGSWLIFSVIYFGSLLPNSATEKVSGKLSNNFSLNHLWVAQHLASDGYLLAVPVLVFLLTPLLIRKYKLDFLLVVIAIGLWPLLHGTFFSITNLGGQYDWYLGVLYAPNIICIGLLLAYVLSGSKQNRNEILRGTSLILIPILFFAGHNLSASAAVLQQGHQVSDYEAFEKTRQGVGIWLDMNTKKSDVVETCFGWIAWGARSNPILETCPLSTRKSVSKPTWFVNSSFPGDLAPAQSDLGTVVKTSRSSQGMGGATWVIHLKN